MLGLEGQAGPGRTCRPKVELRVFQPAADMANSGHGLRCGSQSGHSSLRRTEAEGIITCDTVR